MRCNQLPKMNPIHHLAPLVVCTSLLLTGCAGVVSTAPTYPQDHVVTGFPPFSIAIDKCYWNDGLLQGKIPPEMLSSFAPEVQEVLLRIPRGGQFLVVEFTVTNTGNQPAVFPGMEEGPPPHLNHPPVFTLSNTINGDYYSLNAGRRPPGRGACLLADFIVNGSAAINPGQSTKGFLAFAVPPGDYQLNFYWGDWIGLGGPTVPSPLNRYGGRWLIFNWTLNPTGG
jgi:hypothetical protein